MHVYIHTSLIVYICICTCFFIICTYTIEIGTESVLKETGTWHFRTVERPYTHALFDKSKTAMEIVMPLCCMALK